MTTTTSSHDETTNGITLAWSLELMEKLVTTNFPDDGRRYVIVGWEQWSQLMAIDQPRAEYVGESDHLFHGMTAKNGSDLWDAFWWFNKN
ncbi:MAG: hypothetical protein CM15mP34_2440 [Gammaproteobacteria bacterium]|nr:MAG: hypothetical protein CM15mP34_2440 [Gammaproteobacteria bacterium]